MPRQARKTSGTVIYQVMLRSINRQDNFGKHDNRYNEKVVEYSANSMIKRFQRRGKKSNGIYGKVDNLHIKLNGNRPVIIIEDAGNQTVYGAMEFQSNSTGGLEYGYDGNGSLIWDANKQIAHIAYDNLNYPKEVQFTNGNRIQYVYSPDGRKLRATWQTAVGNIVVPLNSTTNLNNSQISSTTRTDYIGNVIYTGTTQSYISGDTLSKYLFDGGYATVTPSTQPVFHYYTQDHLGNNRAVVNQSGTVEQITHYYPFGGFFADAGTNSSLQPYKYNGKELDRMHGLDLYDYGFRQYDPVVPIFTQVDPMAENYYYLSPYVYCGNNPVKYVDPNGMDWIYTNYDGEQFVYFDDRINSQEDINKYYYGNKGTHTITYLGKTGSIYQGTKYGDKLSYILNLDGSYSDSDGNLLTQEVSIGEKLHIGSSVVQINEQSKSNYYGVYLGPNNPNNGSTDLYSIPPIDRLDYAAYRHDKGYDSKNVAGFAGVFYNSLNYGDDWNLAVRALNEVLTSTVGTTTWGWALGTSALFGTLAVMKKVNELRK